MRKLELSLAVLAAALGWGLATPPASAQGDSNFERDRNVSVRGRARPEYDAAGVRMGGFRLYPEVTAAAEFTDNVFGTDANEEEDLIWHVNPSLDLRSQWTTHELNFALDAPSRFYSDFDDNNATDLIGAANGRLDVYRDFNVFGGARYAAMSEPLQSSPTALPLDEPIEYTQASGNLGFVKAFNRLRVSGEARHAVYDYDDGVLFDLTPVDQDDRDRTVTEFGMRADYAISPMTALFVAGSVNQRDYDLDPPDVGVNRDSEGYEALVGASFDLTRLIRGELGVGYLNQEYDDPNVGDSSGLAVRSNLEWFPDELITVSLGAERSVRDAGAVGASSYISNDVSVGVDYEWRRNVILGASVGYSLDDYQGVDREDERWASEFSVDYLVNRGAALFIEAGHYEQSSDGLFQGREYTINRALIGIRLRR